MKSLTRYSWNYRLNPFSSKTEKLTEPQATRLVDEIRKWRFNKQYEKSLSRFLGELPLS